MNVSEIGEFGLIALLTDLIQRTNRPNPTSALQEGLLVDIGDDAAAWKCQGQVQLITADSLLEDVHFHFPDITWEELGYKAIAINLSDIAAMGGIPQYALASLSLPSYTDIESILDMYWGMIALANRYEVKVIGGNVTASDKLIINITVTGYALNKNILKRSAALPGDKIAITGFTGLSSAGMEMMLQNINFEDDAAALFRTKHNRPEPRIEQGQLMLKSGVKCAIDISDGLLSDLKHICEMSGVTAVINQDAVPIHPVLKANFPENYLEMALTGGEDYELLFTATPTVMNKVKRLLKDDTFVIGEIEAGTAGDIFIVDSKGNRNTWQKLGWDHFK